MKAPTDTWYRWDGTTLRLELTVRPRAAADGPAGVHGERLRVRLQAPPVDGEANRRLLNWAAGEFDVPKRAVRLLRGEKGRAKSLAIDAPGRVPDWFAALASR